jgi:aspartate/methionine/tyrosine aminotransferase
MDSLTSQEIEGAYLARFDLGPGYPQIDPPGYLRRLYLNHDIEELSLKYPPEWTTSKQNRVTEELASAIRSFVGIDPRHQLDVRPTFSGTVALSRAISAVQRYAEAAGRSGITVITPSPSIDLMPGLLREHRAEKVEFVDSRGLALTPEPLIASLRLTVSECPSLCPVMLLSSPENPTGECWSLEALIALGDAVRGAQGVLLVDHSFITAGVQHQRVPGVWDAASQAGLLQWIGVWDTGKTFGLNEDKLGVVLSPLSMQTHVRASVDVIQFDIARRQKLFFAELLRQAFYHDHTAMLRKICATNLVELEALLAPTPYVLRRPKAGTLALIQLPADHPSDAQSRNRLLSRGVGVVSGSVFFHGEVRRTDLLRVALAREASLFAEAAHNLKTILTELAPGFSD